MPPWCNKPLLSPKTAAYRVVWALCVMATGWGGTTKALATPDKPGLPTPCPKVKALLEAARPQEYQPTYSTSVRTPGSAALYQPPGGTRMTPDAKTGIAASQLSAGPGPKKGLFAWLFRGRTDQTVGVACAPTSKRADRSRRKMGRRLERFCQPQTRTRHTPLKRYKVQCNPNLSAQTTFPERVADRLEVLLANNRRNCKIIDLFSDISAGEMIETDKYGKALVVDFQVKKRVFQYREYPNIYARKGKLIKRKYRAISNLTLKITDEDENFPNGKDGYYLVCLNREETKEVIIRNLIIKGKIERVSLVYPEERENIGIWRQKYGETTVAQLIDLGPQQIAQ